MSQNADPLEGGTEVKQEKFGFGKPGDFIKGTYTGVKMVKTDKGTTPVYEVKGQFGSFHPVHQDEVGNTIAAEQPVQVEPGDFYGIWGGKEAIDQGFRKAKIGQIIGIRFEEFVKSKTPGNKPWKKFMFKHFEMDKEYAGESQLDAAKAAGLVDPDEPPFKS